MLNRYRLAGYEIVCAGAELRIAIDLRITVCAFSGVFRGDVEAAIVSALSTKQFPDGTTGFFFSDRFTFGTPLERSSLEAAIQSAYGVAGVVAIEYRERGVTPDWSCLPEEIKVGENQILRMDNDPNHPNRGTLQVNVEGGK